jgi:hypothetical protein
MVAPHGRSIADHRKGGGVMSSSDETIALVRAARQVNHLIESTYLPQGLADDLGRLIKLVEENAKLRKALADQLIDKAIRD